MRYLTQRSTRQKIMLYLSNLARDKGKATFVLPFNRQQMADFLSVDRSALSAELSKMKKDGLIDYHKDQIFLVIREEKNGRDCEISAIPAFCISKD